MSRNNNFSHRGRNNSESRPQRRPDAMFNNSSDENLRDKLCKIFGENAEIFEQEIEDIGKLKRETRQYISSMNDVDKFLRKIIRSYLIILNKESGVSQENFNIIFLKALKDIRYFERNRNINIRDVNTNAQNVMRILREWKRDKLIKILEILEITNNQRQ
ncbi:hypothetical protein [Sulfuracidifex tepidarius]|nr:hypothetical protein [Sulfuracidifex tepidarius]